MTSETRKICSVISNFPYGIELWTIPFQFSHLMLLTNVKSAQGRTCDKEVLGIGNIKNLETDN